MKLEYSIAAHVIFAGIVESDHRERRRSDRDCGYSHRTASNGSTRAALRAGTYDATKAIAMIPMAAAAKGAAFCIGRSGIILAARDRPQIAIGAASRRPAMIVTSASCSTNQITSPAVAPSAMRMPISFVRRDTV